MIWLTWRQHRVQILGGAVLLLAIAAFLAITGIGMHSTFESSGVAACLARNANGCAAPASSWSSQYAGYQFVIPFFLVLPGLVGLFLGAPLVSRELEQGTQRMVWMQSVSRARWLAVKIAILMASVVIGATLLTIALEWWSGPLVAAAGNDRFMPGVFDLLGAVPIVYAVFAFAVGVVSGVVLGKAVPAMGATLVTFAAVRVAVEFVLRPHYQSPLTDTYALTFAKGPTTPSTSPGAWEISAQTVDHAGHIVSSGIGIDFNNVVGDCPGLAIGAGAVPPSPSNLQDCIHHAGIHVVAMYQPASRYWLFQIIEAGTFAVLAVLMIAAAFWWVQHRST